MAYFRCGGGGKKKTILATNPVISIKASDQTLKLTWTQPASEVDVAKYNIYMSTTNPAVLDDMEKVADTTQMQYTLSGLINGQIYYVVVTSTNEDGIENASIVQLKSAKPSSYMIIVAGDRLDGVYYSMDGETYNKGNFPDDATSCYFGTACYNSDLSQFHIWENNSSGAKTHYYSNDGINWIKGTGGYYFSNVIYVNGYYYGLLSTSILRSSDLNSWTYVKSGSAVIKCITYSFDQNKFVAVGSQGYCYVSSDGTTWTSSNVFGSTTMYSVLYANGMYIACGESGKMYKSTDGTTWTQLTSVDSVSKTALAYGGGTWVCGSFDTGKMYYSKNGNNWSLASAGSYNVRDKMRYINNRFIAGSVGGEYGMMHSVDGINWVYDGRPSSVGYSHGGIATNYDPM